MDAKEHEKVADLHAKILSGTYNENDVHLLLLMLRNYADSKAAPIREIGDFMAHREKDRGPVFNYMQRTKAKFDSLIPANQKRPVNINIAEVFSVLDFRDSLNVALAKFGLTGMSEIIVNDMLICIISILHDVRIVRADGMAFGLLRMAVSPTKIQLIGEVEIANTGRFAQFAVLIARNTWAPDCIPSYFVEPPQVEVKNGILILR